MIDGLPPLLGAKLLPPARGAFHLMRPRLNERLASGLDGRATVVLAGPGYGKTSLVARFLEQSERDSVWLSLDATDRDPWTFFAYLIRGIRENTPEFGERSEGLWRDLRSRPDEAERFADVFIRDAEESLGGPVTLVLDEFHHFESGPMAATLRRFLAYLPGTLHLILIGRFLPEIGIRPLEVEGSVHILEGDELLFTRDETRTLLVQTFGLPITDAGVDSIHERTRGWVTGLQLLRQTARLDASVAELPAAVFEKTESEIFDYFSEEVFSAEPEDVRRFLLGTSPPVFISPEICSEVLPGLEVRRILDRLLKRRLFISRLESRGEYHAYDPLFRDFLRRKLLTEMGEEGRRGLDRRYGLAFSARGEPVQALTHFVAGGDVESLVDLLGRHGKALLHAGLIENVKVAAQFAASQGVVSFVVEDLRGEASRLEGDYAAAVGHFERALGIARRENRAAENPALASTLQGLAYSLLKTGETARASGIIEEALAAAVEADPGLLARILNTLSILRYRENRQEEALRGWQEALVRAREADDQHLTLMIAHNLGLPHAVRGDFERASECFRILTGEENPRLGPDEGAAYLNLARIAILRGDHEKAASLLGDAREIARKWKLQSLAADVLEAEGSLLRETGEWDAAAGKYSRARSLFMELGRIELLDNLAEEEALLTCRRGDAGSAAESVSRLIERHRASGDPGALATSLLARGEIAVRGGGGAGPARAFLEEAAALFETQGRSHERCASLLWLAMARHMTADAAGARRAAEEALEISKRFDYRSLVSRVVGLDESFRRMCAALPSAPESVRETAAPVEAAPSRAVSATTGSDLTIRLLGPVEVFREEERKIPARAWKLKRALQVFCLVASSRGHRISKDRIADALWGDARASVIEKNFHPTISFLRRALNHGHNVPKNFILYEGGAYLLNTAYSYDIDVESFETRIRSARQRGSRGDAPAALGEYEAALGLYRGPFLEDEYGDWAAPARARLETLWCEALAESGELHLRAGNPDAAVACLQRLVDHDPLDERASIRLMKAHAAKRSRRAVEREFERLIQRLQEEMQEDPQPETRRAYNEALAAAGEPPDAGKKTFRNRPRGA